MDRSPVPVISRDAVSADGTRIRFHVHGAGPQRWLIPPGMGTPALCWTDLWHRLGDRVSIATWDLRGCYGSEKPQDREAISVQDHAMDGLAVLRALGWEDAPVIVGGWSLGVQISLEVRRLLGSQVAGLVLICGAFEHVLRTALPLPYADRLLDPFLRGLLLAEPLLRKPVVAALGSPYAQPVLRALGATTTSDPFFATVMREFQQLDLGHLAQMTRAANRHSARDLLPHITQPTLIIAGSHDTMTPPGVSREMHRLVPGSELLVVDGGTHYTILEHPELVGARIERFLAERGLLG